MAPSFCAIILSSILATQPVLAGSRAWESSIVYTHPSNAERTGELLGSVTKNATNGTGLWTSLEPLQKRYVTINPGSGNSDDRLWPNGKISYCFESAATKELFSKDLVEARILWEDSGLGSGFDWEEKDSAFCNNAANRPKFLLVVKSDGLSCTTGVPPLNKMSGDRGPLMRLTADLDIGKQNLVANFAHEMGHAWGLHHEHQNPAWWSSDYAAANGNVFGASNFKCENLADYASVSQRLTAEQMKKACASRAFAKTHRFSAAEYLPFTDSTTYRASKSANEPDWDPIMIYGSGDSLVLTKPNGDAIKQNLAPSQQDVAGLKKLYSISSSSKFNPLGSKSNTKLNKFKEIRKKDQGSGCKEASNEEDDDEDSEQGVGCRWVRGNKSTKKREDSDDDGDPMDIGSDAPTYEDSLPIFMYNCKYFPDEHRDEFEFLGICHNILNYFQDFLGGGSGPFEGTFHHNAKGDDSNREIVCGSKSSTTYAHVDENGDYQESDFYAHYKKKPVGLNGNGNWLSCDEFPFNALLEDGNPARNSRACVPGYQQEIQGNANKVLNGISQQIRWTDNSGNERTKIKPWSDDWLGSSALGRQNDPNKDKAWNWEKNNKKEFKMHLFDSDPSLDAKGNAYTIFNHDLLDAPSQGGPPADLETDIGRVVSAVNLMDNPKYSAKRNAYCATGTYRNHDLWGDFVRIKLCNVIFDNGDALKKIKRGETPTQEEMFKVKSKLVQCFSYTSVVLKFTIANMH